MVHAVTTTCLHCKYSFELQRRQAEDPRVVHAMTLASAVEDFFQLKNRQRERERAHILGPICSDRNLHALQVIFGVGEETIEGGHGADMQ